MFISVCILPQIKFMPPHFSQICSTGLLVVVVSIVPLQNMFSSTPSVFFLASSTSLSLHKFVSLSLSTPSIKISQPH
ncbi:hypothetical protein Fmac_003034 [Flemingia macrophylla]|uniref:Uncharacterized protein n=1 Tax=Flemingia macrophylla TaxID=520843 RepID=A0ABD1NLL9_9FABA